MGTNPIHHCGPTVPAQLPQRGLVALVKAPDGGDEAPPGEQHAGGGGGPRVEGRHPRSGG